MTCGACGGGTGDGQHLCARCTEYLEADLKDVESTVESIWASAARLDVGNGSVGTSGHSEPSDPINRRAYDTARTLNVILTGWARAIGHTQPHAVKAANVLISHIREVREQDWAPVLKQELRDALNDCRRATDRNARRVFAGICPTEENGEACNTPVYAPEGKPEAKCPTCYVVWDVTEWRERAVDAAVRSWATATELSLILSDPLRALVFPKNKIAVWVNRGKLTHINEHERRLAAILEQPIPAKLYQVRKVRNLWERSLIESAVRSERMRTAREAREQAEAAELAAKQRESMAA